MKIAILSNNTSSLFGQRKEVLISLLQAKHNLAILAPVGQFEAELKEMGCHLSPVIVNRKNTNPVENFKLFFQYYKQLKKLKPDVMLSYHIKPNIYGGLACQWLKIPYLPNITGLGTAVEYPGKLQKLTIFLYKLAMHQAYAIFFQNTDNKKFFKKHGIVVKQTHEVLLPGSGINLTDFSPLPYPMQEQTHFLFVSRILKEKGIDLYLAAARRFSTPNVKFHICGAFDSQDYQAKVEQAVKDEFVIYHGQQKDMKPFFEQCSCLLHPSWYPEGMSNVLLEAAASARPAITTNRPGCREVVEDGKTGFVVPVQDEQAFLSAVEKFLALPWEKRREMGLNARAKVEKEFDRQIVVDAYLKEIEGIQQNV